MLRRSPHLLFHGQQVHIPRCAEKIGVWCGMAVLHPGMGLVSSIQPLAVAEMTDRDLTERRS